MYMLLFKQLKLINELNKLGTDYRRRDEKREQIQKFMIKITNSIIIFINQTKQLVQLKKRMKLSKQNNQKIARHKPTKTQQNKLIKSKQHQSVNSLTQKLAHSDRLNPIQQQNIQKRQNTCSGYNQPVDQSNFVKKQTLSKTEENYMQKENDMENCQFFSVMADLKNSISSLLQFQCTENCEFSNKICGINICKKCQQYCKSCDNKITQICQLTNKCKTILQELSHDKKGSLFQQVQVKNVQKQKTISFMDPIVLIYEVPVQMSLFSEQNQSQSSQKLKQFFQQNQKLKKQIKQLTQKIKETPVINKIYQVPIELIIQEQPQSSNSNGILPMSSKAASSQQNIIESEGLQINNKRYANDIDYNKQSKFANTQIIAFQRDNYEAQSKTMNLSFCNNLANRGDNEDNLGVQQQFFFQSPATPAFENVQWVFINNVYEIPVQMYVQNQSQQMLSSDKIFISTHTQTTNFSTSYQQNIKNYQQNRLILSPMIIDFCSKPGCEHETEQLQMRKRKKTTYIDSIKEEEDAQIQRQQQNEQTQNNNIFSAEQELEMLLQDNCTPVENIKKQQVNKNMDDSITYKAEKMDLLTVGHHRRKSSQFKSSKQSNDIGVQSVYFFEAPGQSSQMKYLPVVKPKKSIQFKKSAISQQGKLSQQNQQENNQNENSLEPSLINGISVIRKRFQHSQTQSNSQIQDYLQVYQAHQQTQNEGQSYESKNIGNAQGMNNCNHCGMNIKNNQKTKGKNRSLGSNFKNRQDLYVAYNDDAIQQRYSQQSRSKRTTTIKNFNLNIGNGSQHSNDMDGQDFMTVRKQFKLGQEIYVRSPVTGKFQRKRTHEDPRQLQLGNNLLQQKSQIMQPNKDEQLQNKKAKQRFSQHPYLNFYQASQMDQISQQNQKKQQDKQKEQDPKNQQKQRKRYSFQQTSILLNFNNTSANQSKQIQICSKGIVQAALQPQQNKNKAQQNKNKGIVNLKNQNNQVYIIDDGDTSSQGSKANRQMKISHFKNSFSRSFKKEKNPATLSYCESPKQAMADMSQFYELQQKLAQMEEEKSILVQKLEQCQHRIEQAKRDEAGYDEKMNAMDKHYREKLSSILVQFTQYQKKLVQLQQQLQQKTNNYNKLQTEYQQKSLTLQHYTTTLTHQQHQISTLTSQLHSLQHNIESTSKKTIKQNTQKQSTIQQYKHQIQHLKQQLQLQTHILQQQIKQKDEKIEKYLKEIEKGNQVVENLRHDYDQIMGHLEELMQERGMYQGRVGKDRGDMGGDRGWSSVENVYQGQFQRCRQTYQKQLQSQTLKISHLQTQLQTQHSQHTSTIKSLQQTLHKASQTIKQQDIQIKKLQIQAQLKHKLQVSVEVEEELDYLRKQLVCYGKQVEEKQGLIRQLYENVRQMQQRVLQLQEEIQGIRSRENDNMNMKAVGNGQETEGNRGFNLHLDLSKLQQNIITCLPTNLPTSKSIFDKTLLPSTNTLPNPTEQQLALLHQKHNHLQTTLHEYQQNIQKLQYYIHQYQSILLHNQQTIRDLQQQVGQYMQDAVQKERQNDVLYEDIRNYEIELNQSLKDKITVEIQNKRLRKMIAASEKRISAIGTRLIHAAKDKLKIKEEHGHGLTHISQNSTLKMRELRLQ